MDDAVTAIERYTPPVEAYLATSPGGLPGWLDELDPKPAPPHHRMGTHALSLDDWFVLDELRPLELQLRSRLLAERRDDVYAVLPSAAEAASETLELTRAWLDANGVPEPADLPPDEPLAVAGRLVQDDLCLMVHREGAWRLDGAALCFPSVWRLHEKLGRPLDDIHAPVEHYDVDLSDRVDRFFDRLRTDRPVWRRNLSLQPTHALFLPYSKAHRPAHPRRAGLDDAPDLWLRSERQTLRRLPRTGAILFTIRTQLAPLGVLRHRTDVARELLASLATWDEPMRRFKFSEPAVEQEVLTWLAEITRPPSGRADGLGRVEPGRSDRR